MAEWRGRVVDAMMVVLFSMSCFDETKIGAKVVDRDLRSWEGARQRVEVDNGMVLRPARVVEHPEAIWKLGYSVVELGEERFCV